MKIVKPEFAGRETVGGRQDCAPSPESPLQTVRFGDLLEPLQRAMGQGPVWLQDFCNDDVLLPRDLYEVLQAFSRIQRDSRTPEYPDPVAT